MRNMQDVIAKAQQYDDYWIEAALYEFNETVCQLMEDSGMNRSDLAKKLGVSPAYITKLLRGDANVTIKTMVRLARVFGREVQIALPQQGAGQVKVSVAVMKQTIKAWLFEIPRNPFAHGRYTTVPSSLQPAHTHEKESIAA